ncbi:S9 family peptidase [Actinomycetospora chlora]|uniref:S9 family peptidase n=1 Tax=Actinomycetospora chlora TaxID=663608 RepID=A0ABP9A6K3_9PSEU
MTSALPYGSWPTPITSELVVAAAVRLDDVRPDGRGGVVWGEGRAAEGGRIQLVRRDADGTVTDLLGDGANARTAVHEYGGGAWWLHDGVVFHVDWADQRLRRLEDGVTTVLTPEPAVPRGDRYADGDVAPDGSWLVCVRERHPRAGAPATEVVNEVVRLDARTPGEPEVLVSGPDFVAAPRLSPDGTRLAWVSWDHPSMPWDDTVLTVRDLASGAETVVAGGPGESVGEPAWQPDGGLHFLSDRTGWWNLYRWDGAEVSPVVVLDAEIGLPAWQLGGSRHATLPDGRVVFARSSQGFDVLAVRAPDGTVTDLDTGFTAIRAVRADGDGVLCVAGSPTAEPGVHRVGVGVDGTVTTLRSPRDLGLDPATIAVPEPMTFSSTDGAGTPRDAHALFYAPVGDGPTGELPPLLVVIHGGPTGAATPVLNLGLQYWTSRGFGVVDVDYGGSAGYGRAYREQLEGAWGVVDVADCLAAARALADAGRVDRQRLAIRGGSAGGFTTLAALARDDTPFSAGADHFGVADLEALAADTHKFESRYLDGLVGPYPEAREVYVERSPITHVERFATPLIVLQGEEDAIVPPNQSEMIVEALRSRGVPVAYLLFPGEQHGFRKAENIRRALDAELAFYARIFGFALPADEDIAPVPLSTA